MENLETRILRHYRDCNITGFSVPIKKRNYNSNTSIKEFKQEQSDEQCDLVLYTMGLTDETKYENFEGHKLKIIQTFPLKDQWISHDDFAMIKSKGYFERTKRIDLKDFIQEKLKFDNYSSDIDCKIYKHYKKDCCIAYDRTLEIVTAADIELESDHRSCNELTVVLKTEYVTTMNLSAKCYSWNLFDKVYILNITVKIYVKPDYLCFYEKIVK